MCLPLMIFQGGLLQASCFRPAFCSTGEKEEFRSFAHAVWCISGTAACRLRGSSITWELQHRLDRLPPSVSELLGEKAPPAIKAYRV